MYSDDDYSGSKSSRKKPATRRDVQSVWSISSWALFLAIVGIVLTGIILWRVFVLPSDPIHNDDDDDDCSIVLPPPPQQTITINTNCECEGDSEVEVCDPTEHWPSWSGDHNNTHYRGCDPINSETIEDLALHCTLQTDADLSAIITVHDGVAYFPTWASRREGEEELGGFLWAVYVETCYVRWRFPVSTYTNKTGDIARVSAVISDDGSYLALGSGQAGIGTGAVVFTVWTATGLPRWEQAIVVDDHPFSLITASLQIANGMIFGGVSSLEEAAAAVIPDYVCCTFRGSAFALSAQTGTMIWKFYTAPEDVTGNAVWGSSMSIDTENQKVCFATGNNYVNNEEVQECIAEQAEYPDPDYTICLSEDNHIESVICLDMPSGDLIWATRANGPDAWNAACIFAPVINPLNCPSPTGGDYDFGHGPMLANIIHPNTNEPTDVLIIGQKSGIMWWFDYETGGVIQNNAVVPGTFLGGYQWGSAVGPHGVYGAGANYAHLEYYLINGTYTRTTALMKFDRNSGQVVWQVGDPNGCYSISDCSTIEAPGEGPRVGPNNAVFWSPISVVNDIVFVCSMTGYCYGLHEPNGQFLWEFLTDGTAISSPTAWNGYLVLGTGYQRLGRGFPGNTLYIFKLDQ